jgi:hypothetical protein
VEVSLSRGLSASPFILSFLWDFKKNGMFIISEEIHDLVLALENEIMKYHVKLNS